MPRQQAAVIVTQFIAKRISEAPIDEQIMLFQALGEILPTTTGRLSARALANSMSVVATMQSHLARQIVREIQGNGGRRNGNGNGQGRRGGKQP